MTDEKKGDELFEDLDKFFAPIRDVDWDEPEEATGADPAEEHVAVRTQPDATLEVPATSVEEPAPAGDDDDAWYDTGQLEQIDEVLGEPEREPEHEEAPDVVTLGEVDGAPEPASTGDTGWGETPAAIDAGAEELVVRAPSEEELQAAAEHFAGSLERSETYPTEPVDVFAGAEQPNDLLSE
ncbi:MAG: hypothetical protein M3O29_01605, partial [Actinomycetota bacterium]|nr:hypothetical protein [Actinomycetota bacterium]